MFNLIIFTGPYLLSQQLAALGWVVSGFALLFVLLSIFISASESKFIFLTFIGFMLYLVAIFGQGQVILNWESIFYFTGEYFLIGVLYAILRWVVLCASKASYVKMHLEELRNRYLRNDSYSLPSETFERYLYNQEYLPKIGDNKYRLYYWVFWWPFNMFGFVLNDLFTNILNFLYNLSHDFFVAIQSGIFSLHGITPEILKQNKAR